MANMSALVAGTGGITLMDNFGKDLGYPIKMRLGVLSKQLQGKTPDELLELLSMEHRPGQIAPAKTSLKSGVSIRPGHVLKVAYNQVPSSFSHVLYDWRADLRYSAGQLLDFLHQRKPTNGRWNLVGHSQGALLIVVASKLMPTRGAFAELVASVALVGAPLAGTVNAAHALLDGDQLGESAVPILQQVVRTWPALYQMLPAWRVVNDGSDDDTKRGGLVDTAIWNGIPDISADLLDRAREAQQLLRDPLGWMDGDIDVQIVLARNRPTEIGLAKPSGVLTSTADQSQLGDGLVPHDTTLGWTGDFVRQFTKTMLSPCREHAMLLNDPAVLGEVESGVIP